MQRDVHRSTHFCKGELREWKNAVYVEKHLAAAGHISRFNRNGRCL